MPKEEGDIPKGGEGDIPRKFVPREGGFPRILRRDEFPGTLAPYLSTIDFLVSTLDNRLLVTLVLKCLISSVKINGFLEQFSQHIINFGKGYF